MATFPALPLWTDALLADCGTLPDEDFGRYLRLLILAWRSPECRLPNDDAWLARKLGRSVDEIRDRWRPLLDEFFSADGHWLEQKRLREEFQFLLKSRVKQSNRAKSRWQKEKAASRGNARSGNALSTPTVESSGTSVPSDSPPSHPSKPNGFSGWDPPGDLLAQVDAEPRIDRSPLAAAVEAWNDIARAKGLSQVQRLTDPRKRALRQRLADAGGIDGWKAALAKVAASPFLTGENDRGWRADFDFMIRESSFTKVVEGRFDGGGRGASFGAAMRNSISDAMSLIDPNPSEEPDPWPALPEK